MIISRTPLRMSFVGGGSDLPAYYLRHGGAVISTSIGKYIYITVNKKFDHKIRASYSITEFADQPGDLKHELIRECLKLLNIAGGIEITSISDIPSSGSGLGSSSTYTIGLLHALSAYLNRYSSQEFLAQTACKIEIEICGKPIGKQDQYAAAYGGLNLIEFHSDGSTEVTPIICKPETKFKLQENLLMLYTGQTRSADKILENQNRNTQHQTKTVENLKKMVDLAYTMQRALSANKLKWFGEILDENWQLKKILSSEISSETIDDWYEIAKTKGAIGGKILGAGGGGFLLLYAPKNKNKQIVTALPQLQPVDFGFGSEGSKIV